MRRRQRQNRSPTLSHDSSDDLEDGDSCFDVEGEPGASGSDSCPTDVDTDAEEEGQDGYFVDYRRGRGLPAEIPPQPRG
jgi:hypothetical protein